MLNEALLKLEQVIDRMIEENHSLTNDVKRISLERDQYCDKLKQLENDNETLLIDGMEQEEKQEQTLDRIKAMLTRFDSPDADNAQESNQQNAGSTENKESTPVAVSVTRQETQQQIDL